MSAPARCADCGAWGRSDEMRKRGLSYVCAAPCDELAPPKPSRRRRPAGSRIPPGTRRAVHFRDGCRCRWCGGSVNALHHVRYRSEGGPDDVDNLLSLCRRDHELAHSDKRRWQPVLLHVLAAGKEQRWLSVPEAEAELKGKERIVNYYVGWTGRGRRNPRGHVIHALAAPRPADDGFRAVCGVALVDYANAEWKPSLARACSECKRRIAS